MKVIEREEVWHIERRRNRCVIVGVLSHPIVPLFIVIGKINSLPSGLQHLIGNLLLI